MALPSVRYEPRCPAGSVLYQVVLGQPGGARASRLGQLTEEGEAPTPGRCHARSNGFDLHAGLVVPARQRDRLERVCRYALRAPLSQERLSVTGDGQVLLQFRQPWRDGTTHLVFDPVEFMGRLAVLVPRPRINLVLYHGVLAPRAAWRSEVVPRSAPTDNCDDMATETDARDAGRRRARGQCWAALMQRTFRIDVLACPRLEPQSLPVLHALSDGAAAGSEQGHSVNP